MSIEFRCTGCSKMLRVPAESAGKRARCSQCGEISDVPLAGASDASGDASGFTTFAVAADAAEAASKGESKQTNPYQSPASVELGTPFPASYLHRGLASRPTRFLGALLDGVFYLAAIVAFAVPGGLLGQVIEPRNEDAIFGLAAVFGGGGALILAIVNWVMIAQRGQSIAKWILGMRIVTLDGQLPGFLRGVMLRIWVPFLINQACSLFSLLDALWIFGEQRRCLHDLIANTVVVEVGARES